jgi:uncharacterized protein YvpB
MAVINPTRRRSHPTRRLLLLGTALLAASVLALNLKTWLGLPGTSGAAAALPAPSAVTVDAAYPSVLPDTGPSIVPTLAPTAVPTAAPTIAPTIAPTVAPTVRPTPPPPPTTFTIPVPVIAQTMVLDCETGALAMGLAAYGHWYSQDALFSYESPDLRAPVMGPNHTVLRWGDPYTNFVGNVNGSDRTPTGYGVYYPVILSIAQSHGLAHSTGGEGYAPATIYRELQNGHPVETWVETNWLRPELGTWLAFDGRSVRYSLVEHAVTLSGVSASQVRVNDPLHGTQYWISKALFEANWTDFDNMAVIFRP